MFNQPKKRDSWLFNYRAHRTAATLWRFMQEKPGYDEIPSFVESVPGWNRFDDCRLHGDMLGVFLTGELRKFRDIRLDHKIKMNHLRRFVRLPADLPSKGLVR